MSKISLKHSGGNVVSLNSPTSAPTSADVAFKLPNADGSANQVLKTDGSGNLSFAADAGGKIKQVVHQTFSTTVTRTAYTFADTGLSASITPTSASSKILVQICHPYKLFHGSEYEVNGGILVLRDSTHIYEPPARIASSGGSGGMRFAVQVSANSTYVNENHVILCEDSPGDTNAHTYKTQYAADYGTTVTLNFVDSDSSYTPKASITLIEYETGT